jgi:hypothetical protein
MITSNVLVSSLALVATALSYQLPDDHILWGEKGRPHIQTIAKRASSTAAVATSTPVADSSCSNGPLTRACWAPGYSIVTDFDAKWPTTGKTVYVSGSLE